MIRARSIIKTILKQLNDIFRCLAGKSGDLEIDTNGDRVTSYQLEIGKGGAFHTFAIFHGPSKAYQFQNTTTIVWPGGSTVAPLGRPPCGFDMEFCPPKPVGKHDQEKPCKYLRK